MDLYFAVPGVAISQKTPEKPAGERSPSGAMPTRAPFPFESSVPRCTTSAVDGNQISYQSVVTYLPNAFWIGVLPHLFLILAGYAFSFIWPALPAAGSDRLANLTIWTRRDPT